MFSSVESMFSSVELKFSSVEYKFGTAEHNFLHGKIQFYLEINKNFQDLN